LETGDSAGNFKGPIRFTIQLAISPDGRLAFCHGDYDAAVEAWALTTGEPVAKYAAGSVGITVEARVAARVESLSLSRDGRLILCGSGNGNIWIWDTRTGKLLAEMKGHKGEVKAVCISPDGKRAVTTGEGGIVRAWDLASGKVISTKPKNEYATSIHAVAISPNGRFAFDSELELWELETGRLVCKLGEQKGVIGSVAISPDGRLALSGSWDGTVKLWRLPREVWTADK
jgi:WD40 repeat protein